MKLFLTSTFLLFTSFLFCQEYLQHEIDGTQSLEIFETNDSIHNIYNTHDESYISKTILENFTTVREKISFAANSKLMYHSKDSIDVLLTKLWGGDYPVQGFAAYQKHHGVDILSDNHLEVSENIFDACNMNSKKHILNSDSQSSIYYYEIEDQNFTYANAEQPVSEGIMFYKSTYEYYLTSEGKTYLATIDDTNENNIVFEKVYDYGNPDAKWISNTKSFGFIENGAYYIIDIDSGNLTKWLDGVVHTAKEHYFTQDALYIMTDENEIYKYKPDSSPLLVFSPENINSNIDIYTSSFYVKNDSIIIGASTYKANSPLIIKIKEGESLNIDRPNLKISDAVCYIKDSVNNTVIYDCTYSVTNIGEIPIHKFSVYSKPKLPFGIFSYKYHWNNTAPLKPNESIELEIHQGFNYGKQYVPKEFFIQGANDIRLGELASTDVKQIVSNKNLTVSKSITLFPNPTSDYFYIKGAENSSSYTLFDVKGAKVQKGHLTDSRIDVKALDKGTYFIHIQDGNSVTILEAVKI